MSDDWANADAEPDDDWGYEDDALGYDDAPWPDEPPPDDDPPPCERCGEHHPGYADCPTEEWPEPPEIGRAFHASRAVPPIRPQEPSEEAPESPRNLSTPEWRREAGQTIYEALGINVAGLVTPQEHTLAQAFAGLYGGRSFDPDAAWPEWLACLATVREGGELPSLHYLSKQLGRGGGELVRQFTERMAKLAKAQGERHDTRVQTYRCPACLDRGWIQGTPIVGSDDHLAETFRPCPRCQAERHARWAELVHHTDG